MPKAKTSKASRRNRTSILFDWLNQVKEDPELPPSASLVAFELAQAFNDEFGGAAWKSSLTLAKAVGLSEPSIIRIVRQLRERGHLKIDPGKRGAGHSNRYFMVQKTSTDGGLKTSTGESKTSTGGYDSSKTHLRKTPKVFSDRGESRSHALAVIPHGAPAPDGAAPEEFSKQQVCFARLLAIWQRGHGDEDKAAAWKAFVAACSNGDNDPDEIAAAILASGRRWLAAYRNDPNMLQPLWKWLSLNTWKNQPKRKPQRNGGKVSLVDIALAMREDSDR